MVIVKNASDESSDVLCIFQTVYLHIIFHFIKIWSLWPYYECIGKCFIVYIWHLIFLSCFYFKLYSIYFKLWPEIYRNFATKDIPLKNSNILGPLILIFVDNIYIEIAVVKQHGFCNRIFEYKKNSVSDKVCKLTSFLHPRKKRSGGNS